MVTFRRVASDLRRFIGQQSGTTAITFALSIVPVLLAGGAAVDYIRYSEAETRLQAALDSGALAIAASANLTTAQKIKAGTETAMRNLAEGGIDGSAANISFAIGGKTVSASASLRLQSAFMQLAGLPQMNIAAETEISLPESKNAEVALVLDYSGSMTEISGGQVKYVAMKNAAKKLVTGLSAANPNKVKIGLVPFSHHVWTSMPEKFIAGKTGTGIWTGCTQDRQYPYNLTDATPTTENATKWGQPQAKAHLSDGCGAYVPNGLKIAPLTDNFDAVRAQLDAMRPYAWTHIALGAEFGYHLLSPNEPFAGAAAYSDKKVKKVMVLLTDGEQTEPAFGNGVRTVAQGESNLSAICANAKASGITVITIAFDLRDKDTRKLLSDCSSDPEKNFFVAEDSSDVAAAFEDIRTQIAAQVYISR